MKDKSGLIISSIRTILQFRNFPYVNKNDKENYLYNYRCFCLFIYLFIELHLADLRLFEKIMLLEKKNGDRSLKL